MAKTQTKPSRLHRFFGWFARHKVTAVFSVLIVAAVLFSGVSTIVWDIQIHSERMRFDKTADKVKELSTKVGDVGSPQISYQKYCTHSNSGAIFATDIINCDARTGITYSDIPRSEAEKNAQQIKTLVESQELNLRANKLNNTNSFLSYDFNYQGVDCLFEGDYYTPQTPSSQRETGAPKVGNAAIILIDCGGKAQKDYFPVSNG